MRSWRTAAAVPVALVLIGCSGSGDGPEQLLVRDSAGVRVTHSRISDDSVRLLRLEEEPSLLIGLAEGPDPYLFQGVAAVAPLSEELLMVADRGSREIRLFSTADGSLVNRIGRAGEAPGEFQMLSVVGSVEARWILAGDGILRRMTLIDWMSGDVHTAQLQPTADERLPSPIAVLEDGRVVTVSGTRGFTAEDAGQVIADTLRYYFHGSDGTAGEMWRLLPSPLRLGFAFGGIVQFPYIPLSVRPSVRSGGSRVYVGTGLEPRVEILDASGAVVREVRWDEDLRRVDASIRGQLLNHRIQVDGENEARVRQFHAEAPFPENLPVFQDLFIDADERLWVERYRLPWEHERRWLLFDAEDRWIGELRTILNLTPHYAIGRDVYGVLRDELNVERIGRFAVQGLD